MSKILSKIDSPNDLKRLTTIELKILAQEIREFIIDVVSTKQGHLGAGLGVVELTIAIHYVFNCPQDTLIWDVGHQAYPHKILTGRRDIFNTLRQKDGLSGFPKRCESEFDPFGTGHSSTSISALLGIAISNHIKSNNHKHIAVIGDASIASGMAFEGLNHAGDSNADILIILNDNEMGIDPNVGALKNYLTQIKNDIQTQEKNIFEALNFNYFGPIDGHNVDLLIKTLTEIKSISGPKLLHAITTKGKGLPQAEKDQTTYHAPGLFDKHTGELIKDKSKNQPPKYQDVFGLTLLELAHTNKNIVGITAAMPTGTSLKYMLNTFPKRAFDVGIAEQHAITLAGGFATQGLTPYLAIYSTFLQRGYDQLIHDIALQNLPVIFCIDRAGLVGNDGATHHGVFDIAFLRIIPNMIIASPSDEITLRQLLYTAQFTKQPIAIRYPRGRGQNHNWKVPFKKLTIGKGYTLSEGENLAILTTGNTTQSVKNILHQYPEYNIGHYDMLFIKPLDTKLLNHIFTKYKTIITIEDGVVNGGFGSAVLEYAQTQNYNHLKFKCLGIPDRFIEHGNTNDLRADVKLDESHILNTIQQMIKQ